MSINALTTSGINQLVNSYIQTEMSKRVNPLKAKQEKYNNLSSAYGKILNYIDSLKNSLSVLKNNSTDSVFKAKTVKSSNESRIIATAASTAVAGNYSLRVNQLAKNDIIISLDKNSNELTSEFTPGEYSFKLRAGDGQGEIFNSIVKVTLNTSDFSNGSISFSALANKINQAINNDNAEIISNTVSGSHNNSGTFTFVYGGTEQTINYAAGNYEQIIDNIVSQLNSINGVTAEKVISGSSFGLKITSSEKSKYIQLKNDSDNLLSSLGINSDKEFAASGIISSSVFSPISGKTQISFSTKNSGYDFRFTEISDITTNGLLGAFGLNIGTSRPTFVQNESSDDVPGFVYQTNQLNSKLTFNGLEVQRNSNEINDLISGVNLKLLSLSATNEADVILTVINDSSSVKSKIESFISTFNEFYKFLKENSSSKKDKRGLLLGDSNASSLLNLLNNYAVNSLQGFPANSLNSLSKLGITFNVDNGLSISSDSQLKSLVENNISEVENFFNSSQGFSKLLYDALDPYSGSAGYIKKAQNYLSSSVNYVNDTINRSEKNISKSAERLRAEYQKLQSQLAALISNQSYFMNNISNQQGF